MVVKHFIVQQMHTNIKSWDY